MVNKQTKVKPALSSLFVDPNGYLCKYSSDGYKHYFHSVIKFRGELLIQLVFKND